MDRIPDHVDMDPQETQEWLDAMSGVLEHEGRGRTHFLIDELLRQDATSKRRLPRRAHHALRQHDRRERMQPALSRATWRWS